MFERKISEVFEGWELKEWKYRSSPKVLKADAADRRRCFWASCDNFLLEESVVPKGRHEGRDSGFVTQFGIDAAVKFPDSTGTSVACISSSSMLSGSCTGGVRCTRIGVTATAAGRPGPSDQKMEGMDQTGQTYQTLGSLGEKKLLVKKFSHTVSSM